MSTVRRDLFRGFELTLSASEAWPLGRYFLRVALDRRAPTVREIAFEPVVGAVTDTCNGRDREFGVAYRYDDEARAIEGLSFGILTRVDLEIEEAMLRNDVVRRRAPIRAEVFRDHARSFEVPTPEERPLIFRRGSSLDEWLARYVSSTTASR